jgi:hypothetical protein
MKLSPGSLAMRISPLRTPLGFRRWLARIGCGAVAALATVSFARAAEPPASKPLPSDSIVELPKFEVTDSRLLPQPESWHYAEIPGFEILSRISERETKRFVRDFMLLQEVVRAIMPGLLVGQVPVPTSLVLCGARGKGFDEFLPEDPDIDRYGRNSLFLPQLNRNAPPPERSAIVVDFAIGELRLDADTNIESDPYRAFYVQYFRYLIRRQLANKAPPWFEEGLVQLFAATEFDRKTIVFAQIGDGFGGEKIGDFNHMLHRRALMSFGEMFAPEGPRVRDAFWSAQCYAFVHFCLYNMDKRYQKPFIQFVQRLADQDPSEQLFKECFKKSYNQVATELRGYLEFTAYKKTEYRAKKGEKTKEILPEPPPVALRDATDAEVGRIKGEVLRLAGHGKDAHDTLIAPYVRGDRDPRLLAAIGLDEIQAGNDARARKFLEAAAQGNVQRARAYLELAKLRLKEAKAKPAGPDGKLDGAQTSSVLTPLFTARKQPPPMAEVYATIAETWSLAASTPQPEHLAVVLEGVRMFPRDADLLMQVTLFAAQRGFSEEAKALAERGVKLAKDPSEQDRFRMIAAAYARDTAAKPADKAESAPTVAPYLITPEKN